MESDDFDTDLDDDDDSDDDNEQYSNKNLRRSISLPRLTFNEKLLAHRSNRAEHSFGQCNIASTLVGSKMVSDDETLVPIPFSSSSMNDSCRLYETSCHYLDTVVDCQLKTLLTKDSITIISRPIGFNELRAFSTALEANLENLTLNSIDLTPRKTSVLAQGLKKCLRLNILDLSHNRIDRIGFQLLVNALKSASSLTCLRLINCGLRDSYGRPIADLFRHKTLQEINLTSNELEEMACILIGSALTGNRSLTSLSLSWNFIRNSASIALFRAFEINRTLADFDLSWNGLSYDGSVALRRLLVVSKCLKRLNISNCGIDLEGAKLIAAGLAKNSALNVLNLSFNPLTTYGVQSIVQALNHNKSSIKLLDLAGLTVFTSTVQLAEKIGERREFTMTYDFETKVHDQVSRKKVTKAESVRQIIHHIDQRNWRTLDYFLMLNKRQKPKKKHKQIDQQTLVETNNELSVGEIYKHVAGNSTDPLTFKGLNEMVYQQRMRDRSIKARIEQQKKDVKKRNLKILETVNQHFPDIDIVSRKEKHFDAIEQLAKPRQHSQQKVFFK